MQDISPKYDLIINEMTEFCTNFNLLISNKTEAYEFYTEVLDILTKSVFIDRNQLKLNTSLTIPKCCVTMYMWYSQYAISM